MKINLNKIKKGVSLVRSFLSENLRILSAVCRLKRTGVKNVIILQCFAARNGMFDIFRCNWGDDLNKYLFENCFDYSIVWADGRHFVRWPLLMTHYIPIGSILSFNNISQAIIYGTGLMTPYDKIMGRPKRILSVRGPKTREALLNQGIDCPEMYGDPALLLPYFYQPSKGHQRDIILVIPHCQTEKRIVLETNLSYEILHMTQYDLWTDVIDKIAQSRYVISESLHGLIIAEAYGIPAVWVEFTSHPAYWSFKFEDFYESIGKFNMKSIRLYETDSFDEVAQAAAQWRPGIMNLQKMVENCPFIQKESL